MENNVYIETSVVSYLSARTSRDLVLAARQQITQEWWQARGQFNLFISEVVLNEVSSGNLAAAQSRIESIRGITLLELTENSKVFAHELIASMLVPEKALADALHIAIAATNGMDYLLTWNCKHIANAFTRPRIEDFCRNKGCSPPTICTPEELLGV